jgi:CxxC motif-containing protein (DUF1111 family)
VKTTGTVLGLLAVGILSTSLLDVVVPSSAPPPSSIGIGALGGPTSALDEVALLRFVRGRQVFDRDFHDVDGLGAPNLNGDSCRACHQDPVIGGAGPLELNVSRFGFDNGGQGPFTDLPGGQGLSKLRPPYVPGREEYDPQTADVFEQRQTPPLFGLGLVDTIPSWEITANEDPHDLNGDGIFGVARVVNIGGGREIGRFGWKAQIPRLDDFLRDAMANELGITTADDGRGFALLSDGDGVADPELGAVDHGDLLFFLQELAPPARGGSQDPAVAEGEALFASVGCATCHVPALDSPSGPVPLYSNLLLHDVMAAGFRGMEEPGAPAGVYRTAPLWGVSKTAPFLHDGRAETLTDAILQHAGEASGVVAAFEALAQADKDALILFLEDL